MAVGKLHIVRYEVPRGPDYTDLHLWPTWAAIERAIRRLDQCFFPCVWLYADPASPPGSVPEFEVTGGDGTYAVAIRCGGTERWMRNPAGGPEEVDVWVSNQGASFTASMVCTSLDEVLRAAEHFFELGEPTPLSTWA